MQPTLVLRLCIASLFALVGCFAGAQAPVPVVMLSDIHFDPFHDPGKVAQLRQEPVDRWPAILNASPSATQAADLQALQSNCHSSGLDSAWPLLKTTLDAAHDAEPRPLFVTLSGDLLAHEFPCRFVRLTPEATPQDVSAFSAKTVAFVVAQLRERFPHVPVYVALGNNDSGCNDYRETPGDAFLGSVANTLASAANLNPESLTREADYSVPLPAPMVHARLIVVQDIFSAHQFATCAGNADRSAELAQIEWLRAQLTEARAHHEHVWVMSHIPPGIDVYSSFRHYLLSPSEVCKATPRAFLADTSLADALLDYADVVRLALFGHTHMDEIRLLHRSGAPQGSEAIAETATSATSGIDGSKSPHAEAVAIPAKLVPSVTPYVGNHPAFLVGYVDPRTSVLKDWRTFVSPGPEGSAPPWAEAYRFTATYHLPDFSAASVLKLADGFTADKQGQSAESAAFRQHFYPGDIGIYALGLGQIWPAFACAVREDHPSAVHDCICAAVPAPKD